MRVDFFKPTPSAYIICLDGQVVEESGVHGVIYSFAVADRLRDSLSAKYPEKDVALFGCFGVLKR